MALVFNLSPFIPLFSARDSPFHLGLQSGSHRVSQAYCMCLFTLRSNAPREVGEKNGMVITSTLLVIREMQMKPTMRYHYKSTSMALIKITGNAKSVNTQGGCAGTGTLTQLVL